MWFKIINLHEFSFALNQSIKGEQQVTANSSALRHFDSSTGIPFLPPPLPNSRARATQRTQIQIEIHLHRYRYKYFYAYRYNADAITVIKAPVAFNLLVRPFVRLSVCPFVRSSVRPLVRSSVGAAAAHLLISGMPDIKAWTLNLPPHSTSLATSRAERRQSRRTGSRERRKEHPRRPNITVSAGVGAWEIEVSKRIQKITGNCSKGSRTKVKVTSESQSYETKTKEMQVGI